MLRLEMGAGQSGPLDPWAFYKIVGFGPKNLISGRVGLAPSFEARNKPKFLAFFCYPNFIQFFFSKDSI